MRCRSLPVTVACLVMVFASNPCVAAEQSSKTSTGIRKFFERNPEADSDRDGILTLKEARAFVKVIQARERPLAPTHVDVEYGPHSQNRLDLWLADSTDGATPVAVYIHGGGFTGGDKSPAPYAAIRELLDAGVSVASINYRLLESGPYPIPMQDGARALQFLRHHADEYVLDKERFACFGGSAGACMSMWLAMHDDRADPDSDDPVLRESSRVLCAAPIAGQSTLDYRVLQEWFGVRHLTVHPSLRLLFGIEDLEELGRPEIDRLVADASPISHATADDPPIYAVYSQGDTPVDAGTMPHEWVHHPRLGIKLKERLDELGVECHVQYPGGPEIDEYDDIVDFLIQKLTSE